MKESEEPIGFVKELIRIVYAFGGNKDLFHKKVIEVLDVNSLKEKGIVQIEDGVLSERLRRALNEKKLSEKEYVLCCLWEQGFSPKEITLMLGLKNNRSVYVKQSRIKKKLRGEAAPQAVFVLLMISVTAYILLTLFNISGF